MIMTMIMMLNPNDVTAAAADVELLIDSSAQGDSFREKSVDKQIFLRFVSFN